MSQAMRVALFLTDDPPVHYGLTIQDVRQIAACYDWEGHLANACWSQGKDYATVGQMILAEPNFFLACISHYYGDDYYKELAPELWEN